MKLPVSRMLKIFLEFGIQSVYFIKILYEQLDVICSKMYKYNLLNKWSMHYTTLARESLS
jgi:hypothetical protein